MLLLVRMLLHRLQGHLIEQALTGGLIHDRPVHQKPEPTPSFLGSIQRQEQEPRLRKVQLEGPLAIGAAMSMAHGPAPNQETNQARR